MDEQPRRKKRPVPPARRFAAKRMYSLAAGFAVAGLLVGFVIGRATAPVADLADQPIAEQPTATPSEVERSEDKADPAVAGLPDGPNGLEVIRMIGNEYPIDLDTWSIFDGHRAELVETISQRMLEANHDTRVMTDAEEYIVVMQYQREADAMINDVLSLQRVLASTVANIVEDLESSRYDEVCDRVANTYDLLDVEVREMLRSNPVRHVQIAAGIADESPGGSDEDVHQERITPLSRIQVDVGYTEVDFNDPIDDEGIQQISRDMAVESLKSRARRGFTISDQDIAGRQRMYVAILEAAVAARIEQQRQVDIQCADDEELAQRVAERVANYPPSTMEATMWETAEERAEQTVAQWKAAIIREMDLELRAAQSE